MYAIMFGFQKIREKSARTIYVGSFLRFGNLTFKYDNNYESRSNIIKENHYSVGLMYGLLQQLGCFKRNGQISIDTYFGIYAKQKVQYIEYRDPQNNLLKEKDYPVNMGIRIGLTLSLAFKR